MRDSRAITTRTVLLAVFFITTIFSTNVYSDVTFINKLRCMIALKKTNPTGANNVVSWLKDRVSLLSGDKRSVAEFIKRSQGLSDPQTLAEIRIVLGMTSTKKTEGIEGMFKYPISESERININPKQISPENLRSLKMSAIEALKWRTDDASARTLADLIRISDGSEDEVFYPGFHKAVIALRMNQSQVAKKVRSELLASPKLPVWKKIVMIFWWRGFNEFALPGSPFGDFFKLLSRTEVLALINNYREIGLRITDIYPIVADIWFDRRPTELKLRKQDMKQRYPRIWKRRTPTMTSDADSVSDFNAQGEPYYINQKGDREREDDNFLSQIRHFVASSAEIFSKITLGVDAGREYPIYGEFGAATRWFNSVMTSSLYPLAKLEFLKGLIDLKRVRVSVLTPNNSNGLTEGEGVVTLSSTAYQFQRGDRQGQFIIIHIDGEKNLEITYDLSGDEDTHPIVTFMYIEP